MQKQKIKHAQIRLPKVLATKPFSAPTSTRAQDCLAVRFGTLDEFNQVTNSGLNPADLKLARAAYAKIWAVAGNGGNPYKEQFRYGLLNLIQAVACKIRPNLVNMDKLKGGPNELKHGCMISSLYLTEPEVVRCNALIDLLANPPKPTTKWHAKKWHNTECSIHDQLRAFGELTFARAKLQEALVGVYIGSDLRPII